MSPAARGDIVFFPLLILQHVAMCKIPAGWTRLSEKQLVRRRQTLGCEFVSTRLQKQESEIKRI
jgi:hypothetical protein